MITPPVPLEPTVFAPMSGWVIVADEPAAQRDSLVGDHRCAACGYGVAVAGALPECPMCGGLVPCPGTPRTAHDHQRPAGRVRRRGHRWYPPFTGGGDRDLPDRARSHHQRRQHANPRTISVSLIEHEDHLVSLIEDDGDGFHTSHVSKGRLGLKGMHERANILNGTVTVQSTPNHGTAGRARIPVNPPGREGARA